MEQDAGDSIVILSHARDLIAQELDTHNTKNTVLADALATLQLKHADCERSLAEKDRLIAQLREEKSQVSAQGRSAITQLQKKRDEDAAARAEQDRTVAHLTAQLGQLREEHNKSEADARAAYTKTLAVLRTELAQRRQEQVAHGKELAGMQAALANAQSELAAALEREAAKEAEKGQVIGELERCRGEFATTVQRCDEQRVAVEEKERALVEARSELDDARKQEAQHHAALYAVQSAQ